MQNMLVQSKLCLKENLQNKLLGIAKLEKLGKDAQNERNSAA